MDYSKPIIMSIEVTAEQAYLLHAVILSVAAVGNMPGAVRILEEVQDLCADIVGQFEDTPENDTQENGLLCAVLTSD